MLILLILYWIHASHVHEKVHDNVHKRYSDKTMQQAPVDKGTFIGTGGTLEYKT